MDSAIISASRFFLLATYLVQAVQVFWIAVPSAGSTFEMLARGRVDPDRSRNHPAQQMLASKVKTAALIAASAAGALVFFLPLITELWPGLRAYLLPLSGQPQPAWRLAAMILLTLGNLLSTAAACSLKKHTEFHAFGETKRLYAGGLYRFIRNPISTGLAAVYAGFFCYLPTLAMGVGFGAVMLNCEVRIRMEETYLARTFGSRYRHYQQATGKYLPKIRL